MPSIKTLFVEFANKLPPNRVSAFRGALIEKVGRDNVAFHNHLGDKALIYQYPVIQYKSIRQRPCLFCVGDGVDEVQKFFGLRNWEVNISGIHYDLKINRLEMQHFKVGITPQPAFYSIQRWLALNEQNHNTFIKAQSTLQRIELLQRLLIGNILSFAKGIQWHIDQAIMLQIDEVTNQQSIRYKGVPMQTFDLIFQCNVQLPPNLGLGKSASHGFGVLQPVANSVLNN